MSTLGEILVKIGADDKDFSSKMNNIKSHASSAGAGINSSFTKARDSMNNTVSSASKSESAFSRVKSSIGGLASTAVTLGASVAGGAGLFKMAEGAINAGNNVYLLSQKLKVTSSEASLLNRMLVLNDTSAKPFISTMTRLDKAVEGAGVKGNATTKAMKEFGLSLTDASGKLLSMPDQLEKLAEAYQKSADAGQEEAFSAQILGARAQELIPLLNNYAETKRIASAVKGIGIDPEEAHKAKQQLDTLKMQVSAFASVFGATLIPIVQEVAPKIVGALGKVASWFKENKDPIRNAIKGMFDSFKPVVKEVVDIMKDVGPKLMEAFKSMMPAIKDAMGEIKKIGPALSEGIKTALPVVENIVKNFKLWLPVLAGVVAGIKAFAIINGIVTMFKAWQAATAGLTVVQWLLNTAMLANPVMWIAVGIGLLIGVIALLILNWEKVKTVTLGVWTAIKAFLASAWEWIKQAAVATWNFIKQFLIIAGLAIFVAVTGPIGLLLIYVVTHWNQVKAQTMAVWNAVKAFLINLWTSLTTTANNAWQGLKNGVINAFNSIKSFALGIWNSIAGGIKGIINGIIRAVNGMISGLNSIHINVPSWVPGLGGKSFGFNIGHIPYLAKGGIVTQPTLAMIGEAGPEAVVPLGKGGFGKNVNVYITGNSISSNLDIDIIAQRLVSKLKSAGVY